MTTNGELTERRTTGGSEGVSQHDRDLILELARRIRSLRRCDRHIATAAEFPHLRAFWIALRASDLRLVSALKQLVAGEVLRGCF